MYLLDMVIFLILRGYIKKIIMEENENKVKAWLIPSISFCLFLVLLLVILLYAFEVIEAPQNFIKTKTIHQNQQIMSEKEFQNALKSLK